MVESNPPKVESLSPEARVMMVNALEGMLVGTGFVKFDDKGYPLFGPKTSTLSSYIENPEVMGELYSLYKNKQFFGTVDQDSGVSSFRKGLVTQDARVFELCLKDMGQEDYLIQVVEKTYPEEADIELLGGLIGGVAFGTTTMDNSDVEKPTPVIEFSSISRSMNELLILPDFIEEITFLTQDEKNLVKNLPNDAVVYSKQVVAQNGNVYDLRAKKVGEKYFYAVNEVIQDIDLMTGLGTKYAVKRRLKEIEAKEMRAREKGENPSMSVIFVDLDDFKLFNDQYSHQVGDETIIEAGKILRASARETDLVARISGDEFVIILEDAGVDVSDLVRARILDHLRNANRSKADNGRKIRFSLGIASENDPSLRRFFGEKEELTPEMLEMIADEEMYVEKKSKKISKELRKRIRSDTYKSSDYVAITEGIFGLNKVDAWRTRQDYVTSVVSILYKNGQFGEISEEGHGQAERTRDDLVQALFFQDLLTYSKEEDLSLIASEFLRNQKREELIEKDSKYRLVNAIHPQLAKEFLLKLGDMDVVIPDLDVDKIAKLVEYQHAWVDGSHDPVESNPEEIPEDAKWLSLINAFILVIKDEYGERRPVDLAYAEIERGKGTRFDPEKSEKLINAMRKFYEDVEAGKAIDFISPLQPESI